ncbi:MAG: PEGA domain-containing protein [Methanomicrobiales archaeon]|nr:PEGA domain-containing protein [Methanomicrobiales archaeon]
MVREHIGLCALILVMVLACASPVAAESLAIYGSTAGFIPDLHADRFSVAYNFPAPSGHQLDRNVADVTGPSIQVIFIGGDDSFSGETAGVIEQAVWDGKILVVSHPATGKFGDSLPFSGTGVAPGTEYMEVADPESQVSQAVFAGLSSRFNATAPAEERLSVIGKPGTATVLKYSTGEPALAYRKYGGGYVIGWTLEDPSVYLGSADADAVLSRLVIALLDSREGTVTVTATPTPTPTPTAPPATETTTAPTTIATTIVPTTSATATPATTGNVIIHSSPMGATVFLDGLYRGETPVELSGVPAGFHSLKMSMEGRYDYDGSVTAVAGETVTAFGSLPKQEPYIISEGTPVPSTSTPSGSGSENPLSSPVVIGGAITAVIGAIVTIYTQKTKKP